jgi:hypothetical protein
MLKDWVWWQIEASLEHLADDSTIPLSDLTVCFWLALAVKGCTALQESESDRRHGGQILCEPGGVTYPCRVPAKCFDA